MNELSWVAKARKYLGLKEDTSKHSHNPQLLYMLKVMGQHNHEAKAWWANDETPWCGLFVGFVLGQTGRFVVKEWYRARAWESDTMTRLDAPAYGCIVTFTRHGGGHVGFVVGKDRAGNIVVLGGNQGNEVSILPFAPERVTGYYWPSRVHNGSPVTSRPLADRYDLPLLGGTGKVSGNEA